jgi:SAM-dependent methyltransferase
MTRYFKTRALAQAPDYERAYWHVTVDPDGRERFRADERAQHLDDVREELAFVNGLPGGRLLDVGCGLGFFLSGLEPRWERHGVEISAYAAACAAGHAEVHSGTLEDAEFPDAHFDAVVMHHVIEHVEQPGELLDEALRVLRPGGWLVLGTPDFDGGCARRFGANFRLLHDPTHVSLFDADGMRRFLRDRGLVIESARYPFFETRHFTPENLQRLFDTTQISPPFYGSFMTFYARKPRSPHLVRALSQLGLAGPDELRSAEAACARAVEWLSRAVAASSPVEIVDGTPTFSAHIRSVLAEVCSPRGSGPRSTLILSRSRAEAARAAGAGTTPPTALAIVPETLAPLLEEAAVTLPFPSVAPHLPEAAQLLLLQSLLCEVRDRPSAHAGPAVEPRSGANSGGWSEPPGLQAADRHSH